LAKQAYSHHHLVSSSSRRKRIGCLTKLAVEEYSSLKLPPLVSKWCSLEEVEAIEKNEQRPSVQVIPEPELDAIPELESESPTPEHIEPSPPSSPVPEPLVIPEPEPELEPEASPSPEPIKPKPEAPKPKPSKLKPMPELNAMPEPRYEASRPKPELKPKAPKSKAKPSKLKPMPKLKAVPATELKPRADLEPEPELASVYSAQNENTEVESRSPLLTKLQEESLKLKVRRTSVKLLNLNQKRHSLVSQNPVRSLQN
jgi:hypothetical protein